MGAIVILKSFYTSYMLHNKTVIGFGFRVITKTSVCVILGLDNSRYHAQPHSQSVMPVSTCVCPEVTKSYEYDHKRHRDLDTRIFKVSMDFGDYVYFLMFSSFIVLVESIYQILQSMFHLDI